MHLVEYLTDTGTPEVAINYSVVQNKRTPHFSFKLVVQQRFEMTENNTVPEMLKNPSQARLQFATFTSRMY